MDHEVEQLAVQQQVEDHHPTLIVEQKVVPEALLLTEVEHQVLELVLLIILAE